MRHSGIVVQRLGVALGETTSAEGAIAAGVYTREQQRHHRQQSILRAAPETTGPELAVRAGRLALGATRETSLHLHATILDPGVDFWPPNAYVAHALGLQPEVTARLEAMSNSMILGTDLAARLLPGLTGNALVTCGDVFAPPLFQPWSADSMPYGDAGAAMLLSTAPDTGIADVVATASVSDPELEILNRGSKVWHTCSTRRPELHVAEHKRRALQTSLALDDLDRRAAGAIETVTKKALYDAGIALPDVSWVLPPFYPPRILAKHVLDPLGLAEEHTPASLGRCYGHLGAADQVVALEHLVTHGRLATGDYVLVLGIGVGMTWTAMILRWH